MINNYVARMFLEASELFARIEKLEAFILSGEFEALSAVDRSDLKEQLTHMNEYHKVLLRRCSRGCGNA